MNELNEMEKVIHHLLDFCDTAIRANSTNIICQQDLQSALVSAFEVADSLISDNYAGQPEIRKKSLVVIAVKLFNKVRNVSHAAVHGIDNVNQLNELKAISKMIAGYLLFRFGDGSTKTFINIIKILDSTSVHSFSCEARATACFDLMQGCWKVMNTQLISHHLSSLEMLEIRKMIFKSYLGQIDLQSKNIIQQCDVTPEVKKRVHEAAELMQLFDFDDRLLLGTLLSNRSVTVGLQIMQVPHMVEDAKQFLLMAHSILEQLLGRVEKSEASIQDLSPLYRDALDLLLRTYFSLIYLYIDTKEFSKALSCIHGIENNPLLFGGVAVNNLQPLIIFARLMVYIHEDNISSAWSTLLLLLSSNCSFPMALEAIKMFILNSKQTTSIQGDSRSYTSEAFRLISEKFQSDPEFTTIRINHTQILVANLCLKEQAATQDINLSVHQMRSAHAELCNTYEQQTDDTHQYYQQLTNLCHLLIADHIRGVHPIPASESSLLQSIVIERLRWYRLQHKWEYSIEWVDILQCLNNSLSGDFNEQTSFALVKIDSLINIEKYEEAHNLALASLNSSHRSKALLLTFKAALHLQVPNIGAVDELLPHLLNSPGSSSDVLDVLLQCYRITRYSAGNVLSEDTLSIVQVRILKEWLHQFSNLRAWRNLADDSSGSAKLLSNFDQWSYFKIVCIYMEEFFRRYLVISQDAVLISQSLASSESPFQWAKKDSPNIVADVDDFPPIKEQTLESLERSLDEGKAAANLLVLSQISQTAPETKHYKSSRQFSFGFSDFNNSSNSLRYELRCSISDLAREILTVLGTIPKMMETISNEGYELSVLGSAELYVNIADFLWNIGTLMVCSNLCSVSPANNCREDRYLAGAEFLELAALIYEGVQGENLHQIAQNTAICYTVAAAARLDAQTAITSRLKSYPTDTMDISSLNETGSLAINLEHQKNLQSAFDNSLHALKTLQASFCQAKIAKLPKADGLALQLSLPSIKKLMDSSVLFAFTALCKVSNPRLNPSVLQNFVSDRKDDMLKMSVEDVCACGDICSSEESGTIEITRLIYRIALEICNSMEQIPTIMGNIYEKLIRLSSSRQEALEKVKEFQQIVSSFHPRETSTRVGNDDGKPCIPFEDHDIEKICSLAYNFGVMLVELSQVELSEKFIAQALSLLPYCSPNMISDWSGRMEEAYAYVLKSKMTCARNPSSLVLQEYREQCLAVVMYQGPRGDTHKRDAVTANLDDKSPKRTREFTLTTEST